MTILTISKLQKILNQKYRKQRPSLSNLFTLADNQGLGLCVYGSHPRFASVLLSSLELNFEGEVTKVKEPNDQPCVKLSHLVSTKLDLASFENAWDKIVHDRVVHLNSSTVEGYISDTGAYKPFSNVVNLLNYPFPDTYNDKQDQYRGLENAAIFQNLIGKYRDQVASVSVYENSITTFTVRLVIKKVEVEVTLKQFFDYEVKVRIFSPHADAQGMHSIICLKNEEVKDLDKVLNEIKTKKFSLLTKAKILTYFKGVRSINFTEVNDQVRAEINFDGHKGRPSGTYPFVFDFTKQEVLCLTTKSTKYIPSKLASLNQELKDLERNNYYF